MTVTTPKPPLSEAQEKHVRLCLGQIHGIYRELRSAQKEANEVTDEWTSFIDWTCDALLGVHSLVGDIIDMSELTR